MSSWSFIKRASIATVEAIFLTVLFVSSKVTTLIHTQIIVFIAAFAVLFTVFCLAKDVK
jgi:hypothetical protein